MLTSRTWKEAARIENVRNGKNVERDSTILKKLLMIDAYEFDLDTSR